VAAKLIDVRAAGRQHIDRYELVAEIASGGMATVFLARLSGVGGFQRFVAIKRLHPHLAQDDEFVQMFLDEARLAAGIHHPNVVPILEVGASDRGYYLAMEYIEGDTLARLLARAASTPSRLPFDIGLRIIIDMLMGLHAAHELRDEKGDPTELVHRDVSPQNVLVGVDGVSRITDFGVARAATRLTATRSGQLKGKIAYMAPEQAAGQRIDRRADVFAAGVVLWEVLASRRLFKADNEAATLQRVLTGEIPSPRDEAPSVPVEVADVCLKALERDPDKRFATCAQFADSLERATAASLHVRVAPPREVSSYVSDVIGQEIREQRDAVRAWLAFSEPSQIAQAPSSPVSTSLIPTTTLSSIANEPTVASAVIRPSTFPAPRRKAWWTAAAVALLLLGGLATVWLFSSPPASRAGAVGDGSAGAAAPSAEPSAAASGSLATASGSAAASGATMGKDGAAAPVDSSQTTAPTDRADPNPRPPGGRSGYPSRDRRGDHGSRGDDFLRNPYR
jgi:serine/threonine protein kinase